MPRLLVIDTNVLVAGLLTSDAQSPTARLLDAMLGGPLFYLLSPALLAEYRAVLLRPRLVRLHGLDEVAVDALLEELTANALWREPGRDEVHAAPDPADNHLWALLAGEPNAVLVTGDRLLLETPRPGSVVLTPGEAILGLDTL